VGWPVVSAQDALTRVGIKALPPSFVDQAIPPVGAGDAPPKLPVRPGTVTAQWPSAGSRVDQNTVVKLAVAQ